MIRRSTLIFLTCVAALGVPTVRASSGIASPLPDSRSTQGGVLTSLPSLEQSSDGFILAQATAELSRPLAIGSQGREVQSLQTDLTDIGEYNGLIDGIYGLDTQRAVRSFQERSGLEVTGRVDAQTWEAVQQAVQAGPDDTAVDANDGGAAPIVASEGESADESAGAAAAAEGSVDSERGKGAARLLAVTLGLGALAASFGVGFWIANRDGSSSDAPDEDVWETAEDDGTDPAMLPGQQVQGVPAGMPRPQPVVPTAGALTTAAGANGNGGGQLSQATPMGQADIVEGLVKDLRNPDPRQRRKVIWELGQRGNSSAVKPLVDAMLTADSKEKSLVLAALSEIGIRSLKPMNRGLAIALQDENPEVRKNAIRDITRVYDLVVQVSQLLGHATEDEDPEVRQTAAWALGQLNQIRRNKDLDSNVRTLSSGPATSKPIDFLSSEATIRRQS